MKKLWQILKRTFLVIISLIILLCIGVAIFVNTAPQFGQAPEGEDLIRIKKSSNYREEQFQNLIETSLGSFSDMMSTMPDFFFGKNLEPADSLPTKYQKNTITPPDSACYITWYGHSAFLIEIDGKRILIDPMLTETAAPISFGASRFLNKQPVPIDDIKNIDYVIISHDHYDHLDYKSILKLKTQVKHFYTALGVGSHLKKWGVDEKNITELDWWETATAGNIQLAACPARHFSGRGITDRNKTQWASWVIKGTKFNLYFSGDGGYSPQFKEIGNKYGPFDLAMMECGQYNTAWKNIHMMPEESVKAGNEVNAKLLMPIHWGAFALAVHEWTEPIKRFKAECLKTNTSMITPYIGERFSLGEDLPEDDWWQLN